MNAGAKFTLGRGKHKTDAGVDLTPTNVHRQTALTPLLADSLTRRFADSLQAIRRGRPLVCLPGMTAVMPAA